MSPIPNFLSDTFLFQIGVLINDCDPTHHLLYSVMGTNPFFLDHRSQSSIYSLMLSNPDPHFVARSFPDLDPDPKFLTRSRSRSRYYLYI